MTSSSDLDKWSWANQVGNYQYYIHGSGSTNKYVNLSPSFKNPADTNSKQGAKITIDSTAKWNSDMWRTSDQSCHQPGHRVLPLLYEALNNQRPKRDQRAPDLLL
jgi:hypothetical protein